MNYNKPNITSSTGIKYLHVDRKVKFGHDYVVRINISGKNFIVWTGNNIDIGEKVAKKVQELMSISKTTFIEWYDNDREGWLKKYGY